MDLQVDRKKKQANGIQASKTSTPPTVSTGGTMEIPTVVVVGNNENRSSSSPTKAVSAVKLPKLPKINFSLGSSSSPKTSKAPEAHQKSSSSTSSSSAQIQIPMPDEVDGPIVSVTKPEVIPRTKSKLSHVQKATDDMELVEAISPAIEKMTQEFDKNKMDVQDAVQKMAATTAVLDVQPVQVEMTGQPSVSVETSAAEVSSAKVDVPSAEIDFRAPTMVTMAAGKASKAEKKEKKDKSKGKETKEKKEKDKSTSKQGKSKAGKESTAVDIDITPPSISMKAGIEMGEGKSVDKEEDQHEVKKPQRGQKSKDKTPKSKAKEEKASGKAEKVSNEKDEPQEKQHEHDESAGTSEKSGEKSKFFKFGIPVLPDISLNFGFGGSKSPSGEDKDKEKGKKETEPSNDTIEEVSASKVELSLPDSENLKETKAELVAVEVPALSTKSKKKEKEPEEKSSKSKDKGKEKGDDKGASKSEQPASAKGDQQQVDTLSPQKEKSGSSFSFNIKLPSFDKPLLKRKDSSNSTSGEAAAENAVVESPNASSPKDAAEAKPKADKSESSPTKSKKKPGKSEKKASSRPTSPEVSEGHRTTDDEADKSTDMIDSIPGEKSAKKGGGFHMPHIGIKLPKFGHSKQTYSFENGGDNKDLRHSHGPTGEALLEASPSVKLDMPANTPEFKKMTPTPDEVIPEVSGKMEQTQLQPAETTPTLLKSTMDSDRTEVKIEMDVPKILLPSGSAQLPSVSVKKDLKLKEGTAGASQSDEKGETQGDVTSESEMSKVEPENTKDSSMKDKESKPSFVSKGLKGLRDFKDKVAHKLSHDPHGSGSSSDDDEAGGEASKEKVKKEKKTKESRDKSREEKQREKEEKAKESREKSKEEKQREKEEKAKEKERIKAEKKLKKAELKKKSATHSSSSSSSSSDESDMDEGNVKPEKREKKKSKTKEVKSSKEKKSRKDRKGEKSEKKSPGIEVKSDMPDMQIQTAEVSVPATIEQKPFSDHEAKLIPTKPPVVPRKSRDSLKEETTKRSGDKEVPSEAPTDSKSKLKKTKSKGGATDSSSSSSESDGEKDVDKEGKPKKPKRSQKRKAPEIPLPSSSMNVPDVVKITTSAEVSSPPKEEMKVSPESQHTEVRESTPSKTPESGRRSASFGDLSSLQQPKTKSEGPLERAMSMDMAGDQEHPAESGIMPVGSSMEDLSKVSDTKTITYMSRNQQQTNIRDSIASKSSTSSSETLKDSPTSMVQFQPRELRQTDMSHIAPSATINVTAAESSPHLEDLQTSTIQQMMNETLTVMNNIVYEMDSPSLVKSAMNATSGNREETASPAKVTFSTGEPTLSEKMEVEKVAQETVDEIMEKATQSLIPEVSINVASQQLQEEPKVSVTTGSSEEMPSEIILDLSSGMEGGADSFSVASVKIHGSDGDSEEQVSVKNITVTNIKSAQAPTSVSENDTPVQVEQISGTSPTSPVSEADDTNGSGKPLLRGNSKARLLQTVADANDIKVAPLRKDSSLSSSSSSVDSAPEPKSDMQSSSMKPNFAIEGNNGAESNGQTIEISSSELDGIMMSHADFLQKQAAAHEVSLEDQDPENLQQQLKDTFDNWVYVEQKNAAHEHTCQHSHSHSDPEPSTSSSNDDDDGPYSRNGALSPTTYRMETEYKFETSEMRVTSSPIPPEEALVKSQSTVYSTTMTLPQKTVTQITLGDPAVEAGGRIVSKITLDTSSPATEDVGASKGSAAGSSGEVDLGKLPKLESLK